MIGNMSLFDHHFIFLSLLDSDKNSLWKSYYMNITYYSEKNIKMRSFAINFINF